MARGNFPRDQRRIRDSSGGHATRNRFLQGASAEFQERILAMVCCSTVSKVPHGTCSMVEREIVNRVQLDVRALVMEAEYDRLQRYADRSFLVQAKEDTDS